jgi:hypothetical protein
MNDYINAIEIDENSYFLEDSRIPPVPEDGKKYILKCVDGVFCWVNMEDSENA